jgi:hypothetical protein
MILRPALSEEEILKFIQRITGEKAKERPRAAFKVKFDFFTQKITDFTRPRAATHVQIELLQLLQDYLIPSEHIDTLADFAHYIISKKPSERWGDAILAFGVSVEVGELTGSKAADFLKDIAQRLIDEINNESFNLQENSTALLSLAHLLDNKLGLKGTQALRSTGYMIIEAIKSGVSTELMKPNLILLLETVRNKAELLYPKSDEPISSTTKVMEATGSVPAMQLHETIPLPSDQVVANLGPPPPPPTEEAPPEEPWLPPTEEVSSYFQSP